MAPVWTPLPSGFDKRCSSNPERVGRDGFLGLRFARRSDTTALAQCRFRLPLQALAPAELADGTAYLMLLNPTGGVVGGDCLFTQVIQEAGTRVCLTTPSATRVYRAPHQPAIQETVLVVGQKASLEYLPDHVIPHSGSRFIQSLRAEMGSGSRGIFWDAMAAGRVARGERWEFHEVDSRFEIHMCGRPVFLNRARIRPAVFDPKRLGITDGFDYLATLVVVADGSNDWNEIVATMNTELTPMPAIYAGVSALSNSGCIVKLLARTASDMTRAQAALWKRARQMVLGLNPIDLRKY
jgi:urease accessory protein